MKTLENLNSKKLIDDKVDKEYLSELRGGETRCTYTEKMTYDDNSKMCIIDRRGSVCFSY